MRSVSLLQLGVPSEYIPAVATENASDYKIETSENLVPETVDGNKLGELPVARVSESTALRDEEPTVANDVSSDGDAASTATVAAKITMVAEQTLTKKVVDHLPSAPPVIGQVSPRGQDDGTGLSKRDAAGFTSPRYSVERAREGDAAVVLASYGRASQEFGRLGDCTTPDEMAVVVKAGITSLAEDAASISVRIKNYQGAGEKEGREGEGGGGY